MGHIKVSLLLFVFAARPCCAQNFLSLTDFLRKVSRHNLTQKSIEQNEISYESEKAKGYLLTSPVFFSDLTFSKDSSSSFSPEYNGSEKRDTTLKMGIEKLSSFGLMTRIYGINESQKILGATALKNPDQNIKTLGAAIEIELPLLRNGLGRDIELKKNISELTSQLGHTQANFLSKQILNNAQNIYINAVKEREIIKLQRDLVLQGQKLVKWVNEKKNDRLLEQVHLSQAESSLRSRELGLEMKLTQSHAIEMELLNFIEENVESTSPEISTLEELEKLILKPQHFSERQDISSKMKNVQIEVAQLNLDQEALRPDLSLKSRYAVKAWDISVQLKIPLDFENTKKAHESIKAKMLSKEFELQKDKIESEKEFKNLSYQLQKYENQIIITKKLITSQEERLKQERLRQKLGRASTFDIILAEQELAESKIQLVEVRCLILEALTRLKLYEI